MRSSGDIHLNSNTSWQVLEIRKDEDTDPYKQYICSPRYIDAPICRDRDSDGDGVGADGQALKCPPMPPAAEGARGWRH